MVFLLPFMFNAQQTNSDEINRYLRKSANKKKTANILLFTGGGLILTGLIVGSSGNQKGSYLISGNELAGVGLFGSGVLSAVASVPFYISAHHNKKKSLKISPVTGIIQLNSITEPKNYALAGLKITF